MPRLFRVLYLTRTDTSTSFQSRITGYAGLPSLVRGLLMISDRHCRRESMREYRWLLVRAFRYVNEEKGAFW